MGLTLDIIARTMCSKDVRGEVETDAHRRRGGAASQHPDLLGFPNGCRGQPPAYRRVIAEFTLLTERRADGIDRGDLLSMLLAASPRREGMDDKQLRDEILTIFLAGHETPPMR